MNKKLTSLYTQDRGTMPQIQSLWAFVAVDPEDENEGVIAFLDFEYHAWVPLIAADEARLGQMREIAEDMARADPSRPIKLVKFTMRVELETLGVAPESKGEGQ